MSRRFVTVLIFIFILLSATGCITFDYDSQDSEPVLNGTRATVTQVTDGDTVDVRYQNGSTDTIRVYGIDTPEKSTRLTGTEEFGVASDPQGVNCLEEHASEATSYAEDTLEGKTVRIVGTSGPSRGDFGRQLRYIIPPESNETYGQMILRKGLARVYDDRGRFDNYSQYTETERAAKANSTGLWECSEHNSNIGIFEVRADSFGSDTENPTEFVEIGNIGNSNIQLDKYQISDASGKSLELESGNLEPGETIQIHTCSVSGYVKNAVVWDYCSGIWNNGGDTVRVTTDSGSSIELSYD